MDTIFRGRESELSCLGSTWGLSSREVLCLATLSGVRFWLKTMKLRQPRRRVPEFEAINPFDKFEVRIHKTRSNG